MTPTREQILTRLRESKQALEAEFPLTRLALFGSYARATQIGGESDVGYPGRGGTFDRPRFCHARGAARTAAGHARGPSLATGDKTLALEANRAGTN